MFLFIFLFFFFPGLHFAVLIQRIVSLQTSVAARQSEHAGGLQTRSQTSAHQEEVEAEKKRFLTRPPASAFIGPLESASRLCSDCHCQAFDMIRSGDARLFKEQAKWRE